VIDIFTELDKFNGIVFNEDAHTYYYDGTLCTSVTTVIGRYKEPFDTQKIATAYAVKRGLSVFDVIEEWEKKKNDAATKGTHAHKYAELKFASKQYGATEGLTEVSEILHRLFGMVDAFHRDSKGKLIPIKSEMVAGDKDRRICGMIDQLFYNVRANEFQIWDYKTNKSINKTNGYKKKMTNGLWHLDECEFNTYSLQLGLYKKIIEENTNIKIGNSYICWINENNDTYKPMKVADMHTEVNHIWSSLAA
jgi:ATP-dependent exoDNAse (exonuclease V) beta subunit